MPQPPFGVGLIGVGWMGRLHSQAYQRVNYHYPDLTRRPVLLAAADPAPARAALAVEGLGYRRTYDDWRDLLADDDITAVSITAPNALHREMAVAAAEAGKHVWLEKPVGRTLDETLDVAAAIEKAGVRSAVGFNYRNAPAVQYVRDLLAGGALGRITHVRGVFLNDYAAEPRGALSWRFQRDLAGSGALGDLMTHTIDLLRYLLGPISEVCAILETFIPERPVVPPGESTHFTLADAAAEKAAVENEDYAGALIRFAHGGVGVVESSRITVGPRCQLGFDIHGTDGAVSWDFERMNELRLVRGRSGPDHGYTTVLAHSGQGDYARFQPGPAIAMGYDDLKVIEAASFLRSIETGEPDGATVTDAVAAMAVIEAMARSAAHRRWEPVEHQR